MGIALCRDKSSTEVEPSIFSFRNSTLPNDLPEQLINLDEPSKSEPSNVIEITLKCVNLLTDNRFALLNPVIHILVESGFDYVKKAETETVLKTLNPIFSNKIKISYGLKYCQKLKFEVFDYKIQTKSKELIGVVFSSIHEIAVKHGPLVKDIQRKGKKVGSLYISMSELNYINDFIKMQWEFSTTCKYGHSILRLFREEEKQIQTIYQTESQDYPYSNSYSGWEQFGLTMNRLCKGDDCKPLTCEMVSIDDSETVIFSTKFSLRELKELENYSVDFNNDSVLQKLQLVQFQVSKQSSFIQYVQSDVKFTVIYGIDFSSSIGHEEEDNPYIKTISSLQEVLQFYSNEPSFLAFGTGGTFREVNETSNFFSISGNIFRPRICNSTMLNECYKTTLFNVSPSHDPKLSPFFKNLLNQFSFEKATCSTYQIVIFMNSQDINDKPDLKTVLQQLVKYPVSIIFIGLAQEFESFNTLKQLVNEIRLEAEREYISFGYSWETFDLLENISSQVLQFFKINPIPIAERLPRVSRTITLSAKLLNDKIKSNYDFYSNCKNLTIEKMKDSGYNSEKIFEVELKGIPYFVHDFNVETILPSMNLKSKTVRLTRQKSNKAVCISCGRISMKFTSLRCGCVNVCENCVNSYSCTKHN
jgi:hypothetical protein